MVTVDSMGKPEEGFYLQSITPNVSPVAFCAKTFILTIISHSTMAIRSAKIWQCIGKSIDDMGTIT